MELTWTGSTFCANGSCVEVAWTRSSYCSSGGCVEVGGDDGRILLRNSKLGEDSPVIEFTPAAWTAFVTAAAAWDRRTPWAAAGVSVAVWWPRGSEVCLHDDDLNHLHFTWDEWSAFAAGVVAGEFDPKALAK